MHLSLPVQKVPVERLGEATFSSPWQLATSKGSPTRRFVSDDQWVLERGEWDAATANPRVELLFEKAGPREKLFFNPGRVTAAIVTCGGLCPGLNGVIRSLVFELHHNYRVDRILGIRNGYLGLNAANGPRPLTLDPDVVDRIHHQGGTMLGTSRGPQDLGMMAERLTQLGVDILFCVGGDGTQRGAEALYREIVRRGRKLSVIGIPKTIDNDILFCDRTFGFVTAIEKATEVLTLAHNEAKSAVRGIGLVKVMGRHAGYIACGATLASGEVNYCLIPESPFSLRGPNGLLNILTRRMDSRGHAVIVMAEGAGQEFFTESAGKDLSGNNKLHDVGPWMKETILRHFSDLKKPVDVKYIDPSYIIRSSPPNCDDAWLCDQLARHAVHAAMAGKTGCLVCFNEGKFMYVPIARCVAEKQRVDPAGELWSSVLAVTGQPARFE